MVIVTTFGSDRFNALQTEKHARDQQRSHLVLVAKTSARIGACSGSGDCGLLSFPHGGLSSRQIREQAHYRNWRPKPKDRGEDVLRTSATNARGPPEPYFIPARCHPNGPTRRRIRVRVPIRFSSRIRPRLSTTREHVNESANAIAAQAPASGRGCPLRNSEIVTPKS